MNPHYRKILIYLWFNIIVVGLALFVLNLACFFFLKLANHYQYYPFFDFLVTHKYWEMPSYTNEERPRIRRHFQEIERLSIEYRSFMGWTHLPSEGDTLTVNEKGDRIVSVNLQQLSSENGPKVRFFGGSVMWGFGVEDKDTIPAVFQSLNPKYRVYNHAEIAFNSRQNLQRLTNLIALQETIDIVIFFDGVNEVLSQSRLDIAVPGHGFEISIRKKMKHDPLRFKDSYRDIFSTLFYRYILQTVHLFPPQILANSFEDNANPISEEKAYQIAYNLITNWRIARQMTHNEGGQFFAILQPHLHTGSPRTDHLTLHYENKPPYYRTVYEKTKELASIYEYDWIIDMTDVFDVDEYIYIDGFHFSKRGSEIVAIRISELLEEKLSNPSQKNTLSLFIIDDNQEKSGTIN